MQKSLKVGLGLGLGVGALAAGLVLFTRRTARRVQTAVPPQGYFVDVPGGRLHVREQGSGPALLLLHGLGGHMGTFTYGVAARLANEFRVVTVDRPGSGYSPRLAGTAADLPAQAAVLAGLIAQLGLGRPLVVGHSLGGAVALQLALAHPDHVGGLALIAPLTHPTNGIPAAFRALTISPRWLRQVFAWTLAVPAAIKRRQQVLGQLFGPETAPADYALRAGALLGLRPSHFLATADDLAALPAHLPGLSARYGELRVPLWVLGGTDDQILSWQQHSKVLAGQVPGATLHQVPGAGHMLPVTQPARTADFIRQAAHALPVTTP